MKYNHEIVKKLIGYIEAGSNVATACRAVGISRETFYDWLKDKTKSDISDTIIQKAKAKAEIKYVSIVQNAANRNWRAAAWFLERKYPKRWGRKKIKNKD